MRALYLDCSSGISGNMFFAALLDLGLDEAPWREALARLSLPGVEVRLHEVLRRGIRGCFGDVSLPHEHAHRHLSDVLAILARAKLAPRVYARAEAIFRALAEAEAEVHGISVEEVHFHEVGALDAIVDVMSAAFLLEAAGAERVFCSPVRTGFGSVRCEHGVMPVPAPATALLLRGAPTYAGDTEGEFTTPTGAAILRACADGFGPQPAMRIERVGHGAGSREAPHPNLLRAFLGELDGPAAPLDEGLLEEEVVIIETHLDDMTGEALGFLSEALLTGPALDVLALPAVGKKSRPAHALRVIARPEDEARALELLFTHSSTLGARVTRERRVALRREALVVETALGPVRAKETRAYGRLRRAPEHDDLSRLAKERGVSLEEARRAFFAAVEPSEA